MSAPYPQFEGLLALATESVRRDGGFVDPVKIHMWQRLPRHSDWATSVLGDIDGNGLVGMHMLLLAAGQGIDPPLPAWLARRREEQAAVRRREEEAYYARVGQQFEAWASLWRRLPVYVGVAYNYSGPHHYETYTSGAVHIIVCADFTHGRVVRRKGQALCTTASVARHQLFADFGDHPAGRVATCKACLRLAARVVGVPVPAVLLAA